jgi:mono/diheme cytochrome c family protein
MAKKIKRGFVAGFLLLGLSGAGISVWSQQSLFANTSGTSSNARAFKAGNLSVASIGVVPVPDADSAAAKAAFQRAYSVFVSPRCQNCHPVGDAPLQGDDSHVHAQYVKRGTDGHGVYGMTCHTCHQDANLPGANMPPGNPKWGLPPPKMKMVFVGKTAGELCRQLKDPKQNGGRTIAQIITHVSSDDLVGWGWNPGDGRTLPPLSRPDFAAAMQEWADNGAACPD